jgi:hypothetical protein
MKHVRVSIWIALATVICLAAPAAARSADRGQAAASRVADRFLDAIGSYDLGERQRLLAGIVWHSCCFEYPVATRTTTLAERSFSTDVEGVRGYERLVRVAVPIRAGAGPMLVNLYRLIAYPDARSGRWKVWAFRQQTDGPTCETFWGEQRGDVASEVQREDLVRCGQSLTIAGLLRQGLEAYEKAAELDGDGEASAFEQPRIEHAVDELQSIVGR